MSDPRVRLAEALNETKALLALAVASIERLDAALAALPEPTDGPSEPPVDETLRQAVVGSFIPVPSGPVGVMHAPAFGDDDR
jgi:hypothetical protein